MNNMQDEEKDLFIRKKLQKDELVSKKYDDIFENFMKGDCKMNEEQKNETKDEKVKKERKSWVRPFVAIAACALIVTGANVYATTQGYDNIFFLIRDLRNKQTNSTVITNKDELLVDSDTTISYTNIQISDGLFIQINKLVVKDGKADLHMVVNQEKANVKPHKFSLSYNGENLGEKIVDDTNSQLNQYAIILKLNNSYKKSMEILQLKIEDNANKKIATIEINLKEKELNLIGKDENVQEEVKKISEVDLKEALGKYVILTSPYNYDEDFRKFCVAHQILHSGQFNDYYIIAKDGNTYFYKDKINAVLNEAIGQELTENVNSNYIEYSSVYGGYKLKNLTDESFDGLVLVIDDLRYEAGKYTVKFTYCLPGNGDYVSGNIENLDRYQGTYTFTLNENATYTKYKVENTTSEKISGGNIAENTTTPNTENNNNNNNIPEESTPQVGPEEVVEPTYHDHNYEVIKVGAYSDPHTTLDGEHIVACTICGESEQQPHNFGKWYTLSGGTAWTLWCKDCNRYVYTTDFRVVQNSGYGMMEENNTNNDSNETNEPAKPQYDPSTVDNYASTMSWTEYWAPGLKFQYPTDWLFLDSVYENERGLTVNAEAKGWAIGKNPDTNEIIESYTTITVYDQKIVYNAESEQAAYASFANEYGLKPSGTYYTLNNGQKWYDYRDANWENTYAEGSDDIFYIHLSKFSNSNDYVVDIVEIGTTVKNNYKVTNIMNKVIGTLKTTSK